MKPLTHLNVIEFEGIGPGPLCGRVLADLGARVTVIARPGPSAVVDKLSGEYAARLFGEGWDRVDAASRELQKTQGVQRVQADESFVKAVAAKQAELEDKWAAAAAAKGLKDPKAVLAEFRAEIKKVK